MLLRNIRAHLWPSLATLALAFVVSAGAVGVVGASRVGGTPGAVAAMLALYGAVALAEQSARSVVDRSHDVALARLRGMHGGRLVLFAAGPLLAVSATAIVAGSVVGTWLARRIVDGWGLSYNLGSREVVVAVAVLVGAWVTIALVATAVIRRPLGDSLSVHPRRHPASWITTFLELSSSWRLPGGLRGTPERAELGADHRARPRRAGRRSARDVGAGVDAAPGPAPRPVAGQPAAPSRPRPRLGGPRHGRRRRPARGDPDRRAHRRRLARRRRTAPRRAGRS